MAVYVIRAGEAGPVKIGWAVSPRERLKDLQIAHYERLSLLHLFKGHRLEEEGLHKRFAAHHIRGEWFEPIPEILAGDFGLSRVSPADPDGMAPGPLIPLNLDSLMVALRQTGLSEWDIANRVGVRAGRVSRWLRGTEAPSDDLLADLWALTAPAAAA